MARLNRRRIVLGLLGAAGVLAFLGGLLYVKLFATDELLGACYADDAGSVQIWIGLGADVEGYSSGRTPLEGAIENRENGDERIYETVRALLECGANPNAVTSEGLRPINLTYDPRLLRLLKRYGARYRG